MHFEQLYLGCLAQASYLIADGSDAVVVDPRRDVEGYLDRARELEIEIRHVIATHVHADFVAGVCELTACTDATLWMGHRFDGDLPCNRLDDEQELLVGTLRIRALATPGHTPESICLLVSDDADSAARVKLLTGDTMFVGDVGRPDLVGARGYSAADMAGMLYDSLRAKILPLPDDVEVWPGHGAGSACGRDISSELHSTIGAQRQTNWALADQTREQFVARLTEQLAPPPRYFVHAAALNRRGPALRADLPRLRELTPHEAAIGLENGALALDVRTLEEYGKGHLPGSLNIGLRGRFASWAGTLIDAERTILLIASDHADAEEAQMRLRRVGLENVLGYRLAGSFPEFEALPQITVAELHDHLTESREAWQVIDVRRPSEFASGHVPGAVSAPLDRLPDETERLAELEPSLPTAVVCASGFRSSAAAHFLAHLGFEHLHNVVGGTDAWIASSYPAEK